MPNTTTTTLPLTSILLLSPSHSISLKILGMLIITPNEDQLESYGKPMHVYIKEEGAHVLLLKGWITSENSGR